MSAGVRQGTAVAVLMRLIPLTPSVDRVEGAENPWRGSSFSYARYARAFPATSLCPSPEPTCDPVHTGDLVNEPLGDARGRAGRGCSRSPRASA